MLQNIQTAIIMYHHNHDINQLGRKIVKMCLKTKKIEFSINGKASLDSFNGVMNHNGKVYSMQVLVKYPKDNQHKATGKNAEDIYKMQQNSSNTEIPYFLLFVDARSGTVYGNELEYLMQERTHKRKKYPFIKKGMGLNIMYFCIDDMQLFGEIPAEPLDKLRNLIVKNRYDKSQLLMFV